MCKHIWQKYPDLCFIKLQRPLYIDVFMFYETDPWSSMETLFPHEENDNRGPGSESFSSPLVIWGIKFSTKKWVLMKTIIIYLYITITAWRNSPQIGSSQHLSFSGTNITTKYRLCYTEHIHATNPPPSTTWLVLSVSVSTVSISTGHNSHCNLICIFIISLQHSDITPTIRYVLIVTNTVQKNTCSHKNSCRDKQITPLSK